LIKTGLIAPAVACAIVAVAATAIEPDFYPTALVPADNPSTAEKVALGERLFREPALSVTGHFSCASCHQPDQHFTDGLPVAIGATGERLTRNTPTLYNVAFNASLNWDDQGLTRLEDQHLVPLLNDNPVEMGYDASLLADLLKDPAYASAFDAAFPGQTITTRELAQAIAAYVRTIRAPVSAFDRYLFFDEQSALSAEARAGMSLFFSERTGCSHCHASLNFSGAVVHELQQALPVFHVTGVGGSEHAFRAPTLRAIRHTQPYMHDGSLESLPAVLDHYQSTQAERVPKFSLSGTETAQLIAFLESL
jgi:cytochrome c peroxidase